jgi:hypothetical protein
VLLRIFNSRADVSRPVFPSTLTNAATTPAGVSLQKLSDASGLRFTDRLLVIGVLQTEALGALTANASAVTLVRPDRPYPNPERADIVWVLGINREQALDQPLETALRSLAPGGRLFIELCTVEAAEKAASIAIHLRHRGIQGVRIKALRSHIVQVGGHAPAQRRRAA